MIYDRIIFPLKQRPFWRSVHAKRAQWEVLREQELTIGISRRSKIKLYRNDLLSPHIFDNSFEWAEREWLLSFLGSRDIYYDIGANIGYLSLLAAEKCAEVHAFEPVKSTAQKFRENVSINPHLRNIHLHEIAMSDREGQQEIYTSTSGRAAWNSMVKGLLPEGNPEKQAIEATTLDQFIIGQNRNRPTLIKIDVEGWEKNVIMGGIQVLRLMRPVLLVEFTKLNLEATGNSAKELDSLIRAFGYRTFFYQPRSRKLVPFEDTGAEHINVIAVPQ